MGHKVYKSGNKTITIDSDESSISVSVSGFDGAVNYERDFSMHYKKTSGNDYKEITNASMHVNAGKLPTDPWEGFQGGLAADTSYSIKIFVYRSYSTDLVWEWEETSAISTDPPPVTRPDNWIWTTSERNAFNNRGLVSTITKTRWNNFIAWARTVIDYINDRDSKSYYQIPTTANMGSDKILYADSWNAIDYYSRVACGDNSHIDRYPGDSVKGSYFIELTDILNNAI